MVAVAQLAPSAEALQDLSPGRYVNLKMLLVSEDPETIVAVQEALKPGGVKVVGCTGPAQADCYLDHSGTCPFMMHADVAVVDVPPSGSFEHHWLEIPAGSYAERVAARHPNRFVVMAGGIPGIAGPAGEIAHVRDMQTAVDLVWSMATHPARRFRGLLPLDRKELT